jgi:hypothetical protein
MHFKGISLRERFTRRSEGAEETKDSCKAFFKDFPYGKDSHEETKVRRKRRIHMMEFFYAFPFGKDSREDSHEERKKRRTRRRFKRRAFWKIKVVLWAVMR